MVFKFSEVALNKLENKPVKKMTMKYAADTKDGISGLLAIAFMMGVMGLIILVVALIRMVLPGVRGVSAALAMGLIFIVRTSGMVIRNFRGANYANLKKYCQSKGIDFADVEQDWESCRPLGDHLLATGDRYFICKDKIIPIDEICWVFFGVYKTFDRFNAKQRKKNYLYIYRKDGTVIEYQTDGTCAAAALNELNRRHSHIILGYSRELEILFMNNRDEFMAKADSMRPESIYEFKFPQL